MAKAARYCEQKMTRNDGKVTAFCRKCTEKLQKVHDFIQKMTKKSRPYFAKASKGYPVVPEGQPGKKDARFVQRKQAS